MEDKINHPNHYTAGDIEAADYIEAWDMNFFEGNVIKYLTRAPYKGTEVADLKKARWYINRLLEKAENEEEMADAFDVAQFFTTDTTQLN